MSKTMGQKEQAQARKKFVKAIKAYMKEYDLSKRQFCLKAGLSRPTVDKILDGKGGHIETYQKIGEFIKYPVL